MSDLQDSVTSDVQPTLSNLQKVKAMFVAIGVEIKKVNNFGNDFQNNIAKAGGHTKQTLGGAGKLIGKVDGGLGGGFKQLFGDFGDSSIFSRLAIGAGLAGTGIKVFNDVLGKFEERATAGAASLERMNKALESADAVTKSRIDKGLGGADTHRALLAVGGQEAVDQADLIGRSGLASPEEAARGVLSIYSKRGGNAKIARQSVDLARGAASRGVPFAAAADEASGIPGELSGQQSQMVIARIFQKHFNRMGPISTANTDASMLALGNDPLEAVSRFSNTSAQRINEADRAKAVKQGAALIGERANEAINPVASAQTALTKEQTAATQALTEQIQELTAKLDESADRNPFSSGGPFKGGPGSNFLSEAFGADVGMFQLWRLKEQLAREQAANAAGAFGPTRSSIYRPKEQ